MSTITMEDIKIYMRALSYLASEPNYDNDPDYRQQIDNLERILKKL